MRQVFNLHFLLFVNKYSCEFNNILQWLPLDDVKHGMVHVRLVWMHLSSDISALKEVGFKMMIFET